MRTLYTFDKHNYSDDMEVFERFAVRAVIILSLIHISEPTRRS